MDKKTSFRFILLFFNVEFLSHMYSIGFHGLLLFFIVTVLSSLSFALLHFVFALSCYLQLSKYTISASRGLFFKLLNL